MTLSLGIVNVAIFVLFIYLCYGAWRDFAVADETPQHRDRLIALLQDPAKLPKALLHLIVSKTVHTKTWDQEEELKTLLDNAEDSSGVDGDIECRFEIATHGDIDEGAPTDDFLVEADEGTMPTSLPVAGASEARFTEEHRASALEVFMRSDLDSSGTLNSDEEAKQLLIFISYKLQDVVARDLTPEVLERKTAKLIEIDLKENPMDFEAFWEWFVENFGGEKNA